MKLCKDYWDTFCWDCLDIVEALYPQRCNSHGVRVI